MKSKLNGGNVIKGINTWAVSILRYSAAFIDWNKEELKEFDRKTRKYLTIYNALYPRDSVARLYLPRKMGGRGLCSIEDCVELAKLGLFNYCVKSREKLLVTAGGDECHGFESTTEFKKKMTDERAEEVRRKELHGQLKYVAKEKGLVNGEVESRGFQEEGK